MRQLFYYQLVSTVAIDAKIDILYVEKVLDYISVQIAFIESDSMLFELMAQIATVAKGTTICLEEPFVGQLYLVMREVKKKQIQEGVGTCYEQQPVSYHL